MYRISMFALNETETQKSSKKVPSYPLDYVLWQWFAIDNIFFWKHTSLSPTI